jgi:hypothetical protein
MPRVAWAGQAPVTEPTAPDVTGEAEPATSSGLQLYGRADKPTRAAIERELERLHWQRRQDMYLRWAGLVSGLVIALSFLSAGTWLIVSGHGVEGSLIASVDIVALVTVFVVQVRSRRDG